MAETLLMVTIQCGDFADTLKIVENKLPEPLNRPDARMRMSRAKDRAPRA